ncbi:MAG: Mn-containing catalase, partial [Glaciecola sp.]
TDSDGNVVSYRWIQISGQAVTLANADSASTSFDAPSATTELVLTFQLTVTDDDGATATDTININVNAAANEGPTANAGTDQTVDAQTAVTLSGSGTDSNGSVVSYRWIQTSGDAVTLANADSASTSFDAPSATTELVLTFQLTVTDDQGATATDTININVNAAPNEDPIADAGTDQTVDAQTVVTLSGSGTDSNGSVVGYRWIQSSGDAVTLANADSASTSFDAPSSSTELVLTFQLTVTDDEGATATDTININVNAAPNEDPIADAGTDQTVEAQAAVTLSGSGTDSDGNVVSYRWIQISGQAVTLANADSASTSFDAPSATTELVLTFQLTVTDDDGALASDTININVNAAPNEDPIADAGADQTVDAETVVTLSGSGTDSDGSVVSYRWIQTSGDAVTLANADSASTSFDAPSSSTELVLTFQLTATDDDGALARDIIDITVNPVSEATLTVTATNDNNDLVVSWNDVRADLYRVLFWDNEGNVYGPTTTSLSLSITATMRELGGSLVVEAYDELGNSVFSAPINVDSL